MRSSDNDLPVLEARMIPRLEVFDIDTQDGRPLTAGVQTWLYAVLAADGIVVELVGGGVRVQLDGWEAVEHALTGLAELVVEAPWDDEGELRA
jgi:hypothetical protein